MSVILVVKNGRKAQKSNLIETYDIWHVYVVKVMFVLV